MEGVLSACSASLFGPLFSGHGAAFRALVCMLVSSMQVSMDTSKCQCCINLSQVLTTLRSSNVILPPG